MNHLHPEKLEEHFKSLGKSMTVTRGHFEIPASCEVSDLDWNQMDQDHRPWVHRTYTEALRIGTQKDSQLSLTKLRLFGLPFFVMVSDYRVSPSLYYQGFTLFSALYVHVVVRCTPKLHKADWYVVSHWLFTPLHYFFNRSFAKIHRVQNDEDVPIRDRRAALRKHGFTFAYEQPDFLTSNTKTNNVIFPKLGSPQTLPLGALHPGRLNRVGLGPFALLIRPEEGGRYAVWNEVCPHEGGPLSEGKECGDDIQCPWHGMKFSCLKLSSESPRGKLGPLELVLDAPNRTLTCTSFA